MKNLIYIIVFVLIFNVSYSQWKMTDGPGNTVVPVIYSEGNELYVVSGQGTFLSTDDGETWELLNKNGPLDLWVILSIIKKENTLFLGSSKGVFVSNDYGENWELNNNGFHKNQHYINGLVSINNKVFVLTTSKLYYYNEVEKNWIRVVDSILDYHQRGYRTIANNDNSVFIGTDYSELSKQNIFLSSDFGQTWKVIDDTLSGIMDHNINCFAFKDNLIFAGTSGGIFISSDGGENWVAKNKNGFTREVNSIYISDTIMLFGTPMGLFNSFDTCETFNRITYGFGGDYVTSITSHKSMLFAGTLYGLYKSTNNGYTWELFNKGLCGGAIFDIAESNGKIYTGIYNEPIFVTDNNGETWQPVNSNLYTRSVTKIAVKDSNIYAGLYMQGLHCSSNNGLVWRKIIDTNGLLNQRINCLTFDNDKTFAGTWQGIYFSSDNGSRWESLHNDLSYYRIQSLEILADRMFAGTYQNGIFMSTDYGANWTSYSTSFTDMAIKDFEIIDNSVFAATYNSIDALYPTPWRGIFKSTDWGTTWNQVNNGLPESPINCFAKYGDNLFAGTYGEGVYLSTNLGDSWEKICSGLINYSIQKLLVVDNEIFAGTGGGFFKANISDFGITEVDDYSVEKKNYLWAFPPYPMPATNIVSSNIYWDTSLDIENDDIAVYDIFGNKVAGRERITIDKQNAYSGILTWDSSNFPDGIYLIRIIHGTKTWTLKVIVNK